MARPLLRPIESPIGELCFIAVGRGVVDVELFDAPTIREVVWPADRFIQYDERDEAAGLFFGIATERRRPLVEGEVVRFECEPFANYQRAMVDRIEADPTDGDPIRWRVSLVDLAGRRFVCGYGIESTLAR